MQKDFRILFEEKNVHFHHTLEATPSLRADNRHNHAYYEIYVCFEGGVDFVVENKTYAVQKNSAMLIPPFTYHCAKLQRADTPYHRFVINFDKSFIAPALEDFLTASPTLFAWEQTLFIGDLTLLENAIASENKEDALLSCKLFINKMLLQFKQSGGELQPTTLESGNRTLQEVLQFINKNIYSPLRIKDIAQALFLSPVYISQLFSKNMKIGIMEYVKQKKMLLSQELIRNGTKPVVAAKKLGFDEYSTFFRLYKKHFKISPSSEFDMHPKS